MFLGVFVPPCTLFDNVFGDAPCTVEIFGVLHGIVFRTFRFEVPFNFTEFESMRCCCERQTSGKATVQHAGATFHSCVRWAVRGCRKTDCRHFVERTSRTLNKPTKKKPGTFATATCVSSYCERWDLC